MKYIAKVSVILFIAVVTGWSLNSECHETSLSDFALNNIDALASNIESGNECDGCASSLQFCKFYGDWGGCLGTAYVFTT